MKTQMLKWWYITQLVYTDTGSDFDVAIDQLCLPHILTHCKLLSYTDSQVSCFKHRSAAVLLISNHGLLSCYLHEDLGFHFKELYTLTVTEKLKNLSSRDPGDLTENHTHQISQLFSI